MTPGTYSAEHIPPLERLTLTLTLTVTVTLIKTEYWDRAGGGRNIRYEW